MGAAPPMSNSDLTSILLILLLLGGLAQLLGYLFTRLRRLKSGEKYWLASFLVV
jgi:hypothetical protein